MHLSATTVLMKKLWYVFVSFVLIAILSFSFAGCTKGGNPSFEDDAADAATLNVTVTTSFLNDMVTQLAGPYTAVTMIIPAGDDPHLYVPKANDFETLESADLVLYHGLHFEGKMVDVLEKTGIAVSEHFPDSEIGRMDESGTSVVDPHFWFDLNLYKLAVREAADALCAKLPQYQTDIETNCDRYLMQLDELDQYIRDRLNELPATSRYLVTPHDAFNYFARSYGITVTAPQGVSTDSEVSIKDINATADFIIDHKVKAIFAESTTSPERLKSLQETCAQRGFDLEIVSGEGHELFSDSLAPQGQPGDTFIDMYRHNVDLIVDNLK